MGTAQVLECFNFDWFGQPQLVSLASVCGVGVLVRAVRLTVPWSIAVCETEQV